MAQLDLLHYQPGETLLHRHHPGAKFLEYLIINIGISITPLWVASLFLLPLIPLLRLVGFSKRTYGHIGVAMVGIIGFFTLVGMFSVQDLYFSLSGWQLGALQGVRFATLSLWAILFLGVTDPWDIAGVIGSLGGRAVYSGKDGASEKIKEPCLSTHSKSGLPPGSLVGDKKKSSSGVQLIRKGVAVIFSSIGFAVALVLSFFPLLLDYTITLKETLHNRGLTPRKPLRYASTLGFNLIVAVDLIAEDIIFAIASRGYQIGRYWYLPSWKLGDFLGLGTTLGVVLGVVFLFT